ncbi:HAD-IA family hydrolase [Actinophytocola sp.]|uniref:HAD family hydrolase n=1 Tax=Actinophytocola sp. TaxID=1872138 RepID=UPI002D7F0D7B|nr:HAD-IA family hydrolase [Actinophytocola sp.]HET9138249.1 HAD-IA family hydrolase [Actinophytocola sp.]
MVVEQTMSVLIFDFDGTLFQLPVDWAGLRAELGLSPEQKLGELLRQWMDDGAEEQLAVVSRYERAAVRSGSFTPGALDRLRGPGNLAIVTRNSRHAVLAALGESAGRVFVVGREDVRALKPDPEGVRLVLDHFGVRPEQAVLVGDTYHDVLAARAAGTFSVVVRNPLLEYAPDGADRYVDDLTADLGGTPDSVPTEIQRA